MPHTLCTVAFILLYYFIVTLPPTNLYAGVPRTKVSRANSIPHLGHTHGSVVKSSTMRSLKHFTSAPLPPFRYLKSCVLHLAQNISTVLVGCFLLGLAIEVSDCTYYFLSLGATRTKLIPSKMTVDEITNCMVTGSDNNKTPPSVAITGTESCAIDATTVFSFFTT